MVVDACWVQNYVQCTLDAVLNAPLKGTPLTFSYGGAGTYLTNGIQMPLYNAVNVLIVPPSGSGVTADLHVQGSVVNGGFIDLSDPNAVQTGITTRQSIDVIVGTEWVAIKLANVAGTYDTGQLWQITVTPYVSPGQTRVAATISVASLSAITAVTGTLDISDVCTIGTSGGIYQGTGTFASPDTGLKVYNSGGVGTLETYDGGTLQVQLNTTGQLVAGGGHVTIDASGIRLGYATGMGFILPSASYSYSWNDGAGHTPGALYNYSTTSNANRLDIVGNPMSGLDTVVGLMATGITGKTGTARLIAQDGAGGNLSELDVKTTGLTLNTPSLSPAFTIDASGNIKVFGHLLASGSAPTAAAGGGAGTSPPSPVVVSGSTDLAGEVTFGTGSGSPSGEMVKVSYHSSLSALSILLTPNFHGAQTPPLMVGNLTSGSFSVYLAPGSSVSASQPNTTYGFYYQVIGH